LGYDFAVAEFKKHGGVAAGLAAYGERTERDRQGAGPEDFEGDSVCVDHYVGDLVSLAGENLAACFEGFGDSGYRAAQAVGIDAVSTTTLSARSRVVG
jgi:hypothetical protein